MVEPKGLTDVLETQEETCHESALEEDDVFTNEHPNLGTECSSGHMSEIELGQHSDVTSLGAARSTLAEALSPTRGLVRDFPNITSGSEAEETAFGQIEESTEIQH